MGHVKEYNMESMYIWSGHHTISHQIAHQIHKDALELSEVHGQSVRLVPAVVHSVLHIYHTKFEKGSAIKCVKIKKIDRLQKGDRILGIHKLMVIFTLHLITGEKIYVSFYVQ